MALGGALFEAIEFENGRIRNGRFSDYRLPRFSDVSVIKTVMIDRKDIPSACAGESSLVGVAPAIANAIFDASGRASSVSAAGSESLKRQLKGL